MRTYGEDLESLASQGRFDEASQKDVLELAARLQKLHLETMSADEIEQAAVEGGMNPEFVREAIRRVSKSSERHGEDEGQEEGTSGQSGEWVVAIVVPLVLAIVFGARYVSSHGGWTAFRVELAAVGTLIFGVLSVLAAIGVRSLLVPGSTAKTLPREIAEKVRQSEKISAFSIVCQAAVIFSLLTVPSTWPFESMAQPVFLCVMMPFIGAWEPRIKPAFWKGFAYGSMLGVLWGLGEFTRGGLGNFQLIPILVAGMGAWYGVLGLAGHGLRRLFYRTPHAPQSVSARAQMLEQLFELQSALERHQETRAFLSVDVVGSSTMKASANPLEAEYSFRMYQEWVAETVRAFGGEVQLSAGDGAMAMFRDARGAIAAARQLQRGVSEFNALKNRLPTPFTIRCGVAEGKIGIDRSTPLGQIQSPVLDRAAFLQKYAEPGTVVVNQELLEIAMPLLGSLRHRELIDGKAAYAWP